MNKSRNCTPNAESKKLSVDAAHSCGAVCKLTSQTLTEGVIPLIPWSLDRLRQADGRKSQKVLDRQRMALK